MTHKDRIKVVEEIINPEVLKQVKTAWGKELKILKTLTESGKYDDTEFWLQLSFKRYFPSFCIFLVGEMADELERRWRFYQYEKELTKKNEGTQKFVVDVDDNNDIIVCNSKKTSKKNGLIGWADSR
mgnify:FL=1|jgi:hypothetical protein